MHPCILKFTFLLSTLGSFPFFTVLTIIFRPRVREIPHVHTVRNLQSSSLMNAKRPRYLSCYRSRMSGPVSQSINIVVNIHSELKLVREMLLRYLIVKFSLLLMQKNVQYKAPLCSESNSSEYTDELRQDERHQNVFVNILNVNCSTEAICAELVCAVRSREEHFYL